MEFHQLRSFVVIAKTQNLSLAAKQLFTTPPALSAHIKSLEDELKTQLFIRSNKGMSLTVKGELLLSKAQHILDSALEMANIAAQNQDEIIGEFKLSQNQTNQALNTIDLITQLKENCPGISLSLMALASGKAIQALTNKSIDGAYVYQINQAHDSEQDHKLGYYTLKLKAQAITTICPSNFELDKNSSIDELAQQPWITMDNNCPFDYMLKQTLGKNISSAIKSEDDNSRLELVKQGLGLSFIEKEEALSQQQQKQLKILPQLDFTLDLCFIVDKKRLEDPLIKALLQEIRILWSIKL